MLVGSTNTLLSLHIQFFYSLSCLASCIPTLLLYYYVQLQRQVGEGSRYSLRRHSLTWKKMLLTPPLSLQRTVTKNGCLYGTLDHVFFKVFWCIIQYVPEADTLNLAFATVHGVLENYSAKGIRNIWSHIPQDVQRIRDLLLHRRTCKETVNPEAKIHVRIICQEGSFCAQLMWHLL